MPLPNHHQLDGDHLDRSDDEDSSVQHGTAVHWFRRCLRFHDNPALAEAISMTDSFRCIYILDTTTINSGTACSSKVESNKWRFLLESLHDLDSTLRKHNSRLYVLQGQPTFVLPTLFKHWSVSVLSIEDDPCPYGAKRDQAIISLAEDRGIYVVKRSAHTLHALPKLLRLCAGNAKVSVGRFEKVFEAAGTPDYCSDAIDFNRLKISVAQADHDSKYDIPSLDDLGISKPSVTIVWHGGEAEALKRLTYHLQRRAWVACFEQPKMAAHSLLASPTGLGPYLNFGCLSPRLLYWKVNELYKQVHSTEGPPPASIHGQLMLREFFYVRAILNNRFDEVEGNKLCMPVPWKKNTREFMKRVIMSETGFPWIDAIVKQLVDEGWIHALSKHALIGFITHGQLFYSWEEAAKLLETFCLEGDICTNNGISMLISGSVYGNLLPANVTSPVLSGKTIDPFADFIRRYIPVLRSFPAQYIYEPWTAPLEVQQQASCVIGQDYPAPMLDHYQALHTNLLTLQKALKTVKERSAKRRRHVAVLHRPLAFPVSPLSHPMKLKAPR